MSSEESTRQTAGIPATSSRIVSVDTLRGFTMFFIIGGERIFTSIASIWPGPVTEAVAKNMEHAGWSGFYFYDQIFPLFLFLTGLLIPFVISRLREKGKSDREIFMHIAKRAIVLILLGFAEYGFLKFDWPKMRWMSVLGRIGICYFVAGVLALNTNWKAQLYIIIGIIVGYWAAMKFIPVPGYGPGVLTPEGSISTWLDQKIIPGTLGLGLYDRQGILSTFTAISSTMIGVLAGYWLFSGRTQYRKITGFVVGGTVLLIAGIVWGKFFFLSRNVWTSSFVLLTSGISLLLMALFYWIIDVKGWKKWTFFLVVIGMNAITIWVGQRFIDFKFTADALFLGMSKYFGILQPLFLALAVVFVKWMLLYFLYRKKIFLKA
jgi:predicted acyltransferase